MARIAKQIIYVFLFDGTFVGECVGVKEAMRKYGIKGVTDTLRGYMKRKAIVYGKYYFNRQKVFDPKKSNVGAQGSKTKKGYGVNENGDLYMNYGSSRLKDEQDSFYFETDI